VYSKRESLRKRFKLENIILAAPDMDIDVASTRVRAIVSDPDLYHTEAR
jgi:esterase/lipase superfamily enzyme